MKKLYRKGTVHPSPPIISDYLSFLPTAILTLAAALSPEDKEVLAYLISACSSSNNFKNNNNNNNSISGATVKGYSDHPPVFKCDCFGCYTSYWVRWDLSPNRELIHEIIDAYEEGLAQISKSSNKNNRKERRRRKKINNGSGSGSNGSEVIMKEMEKDGEREDKDEMEKGSVRRIVGFIGERIWSVWS